MNIVFAVNKLEVWLVHRLRHISAIGEIGRKALHDVFDLRRSNNVYVYPLTGLFYKLF